MLQEAGLNVWMITGDKAETALAIGQKCSLVRTSEPDPGPGRVNSTGLLQYNAYYSLIRIAYAC
jgi:magnesium-transporting ATPase (P-type)